MKRLLVLLLLPLLLLVALPASTAGWVGGGEGGGGIDPCEACAYIPAWCGLCLVEMWWDSGEECFPWWPECY